MRFTIAPGVGSALTNIGDERARFLLEGDLNQMGIIYQELREAGFPVVKWNVYPGFEQEADYKMALLFLFTHRIEGWWNQEDALIKHGICTQGRFDRALGRKPR